MNVRLFSGSEWIGNVYLLDYTGLDGSLIIDRIQIRRD